MASVLIVEDDERIGRALLSSLSANGHQVGWQRTGASALAAAREGGPDLVLLDLGLPDMDGLQVCRMLKHEHPAAVVVILTARREEMDVIVGLESGADDYLLKPFRMTELLARVRAHVRRSAPAEAAAGPLKIAELTVDPASRRCTVRDVEVRLRPREFDLLARLMRSPGEALTRERLMADVWDENWFGSTKTLDVHVAALRQRLTAAADAFEPPAALPRIVTLRAHGYRLDRS